MVNVDSGKLKLTLLIILLLIGLGLFMVKSIYTSKKGMEAEQAEIKGVNSFYLI